MPECLGAGDVRDILTGAAFFGGGGGGSLGDGLRLLDELERKGKVEIELLDLAEMAEDECAVMVAEIGAPKAFKLRSSFPETVTAVGVMRDALQRGGRRLRYLMSGELGGMNTAVPLCAAASLGIPVIDADGTGRAVPELRVCLYPMSDIPLAPIGSSGRERGCGACHLGRSFRLRRCRECRPPLLNGLRDGSRLLHVAG